MQRDGKRAGGGTDVKQAERPETQRLQHLQRGQSHVIEPRAWQRGVYTSVTRHCTRGGRHLGGGEAGQQPPCRSDNRGGGEANAPGFRRMRDIDKAGKGGCELYPPADLVGVIAAGA
jgi:hypothetical protein